MTEYSLNGKIVALQQQVDRLFEKVDAQRNWLETIGQGVAAQADRIASLESLVAELRGTDQRLMASIVRHSDEIADLVEELRSQRDQLATALEQPAAATADPVWSPTAQCPWCSGFWVGSNVGDSVHCPTCSRLVVLVANGTPAQPATPEGIDVEKCKTCKGTKIITLWRYENQIYGIVCPVCHGGAR